MSVLLCFQDLKEVSKKLAEKTGGSVAEEETEKGKEVKEVNGEEEENAGRSRSVFPFKVLTTFVKWVPTGPSHWFF